MNQDELRRMIRDSARTVDALCDQTACMASIIDAVVACFRQGGKLLTAGNGGSAAEALHMAEECVGRFRETRAALPAIALMADSTALTCIGNDFGFDHVFSRPVEAFGRSGDMLVLFSTSGSAINLRLALEAARTRQMTTLALLGRDGGGLKGAADYELIVPGCETARIQEAHQVIVHLILQGVDDAWVCNQDSSPVNSLSV